MKNQAQVKGIQGYAGSVQKFITATLAVDFFDLYRDFAELIPKIPGQILDIGAGIGRDSWEFSKMGHSVLAAEPTAVYRAVGKKMFPSQNIQWVDSSLPELKLPGKDKHFDFIVASAIFHHLDKAEQHEAIVRICSLLNAGGIFILSLRNGPPGVGTHVFPTNSSEIIKSAASCGLKILLHKSNQPSLLKHKESVVWSRLAFQK